MNIKVAAFTVTEKSINTNFVKQQSYDQFLGFTHFLLAPDTCENTFNTWCAYYCPLIKMLQNIDGNKLQTLLQNPRENKS